MVLVRGMCGVERVVAGTARGGRAGVRVAVLADAEVATPTLESSRPREMCKHACPQNALLHAVGISELSKSGFNLNFKLNTGARSSRRCTHSFVVLN